MGFWDFIAPDFGTFKATVEPALPPIVMVGFVPVPRDVIIATAWANPGSGYGLALRIYYERVITSGGSVSDADQINNAVQQQAGTVTNNGQWLTQEDGMVLVIANTYRIAVRMQAGGKDITNVFGVRGSTSGQQAAAAAAALAAWKVANGPLSQLSNLVQMADVTAVDLSSTTGGITVVTDATAGGGTTGPALSTRASAALVTWNSGTRSKSARGRMYYGPLRETDIDTDGATLLGARATAIGTAFTAFRSSLATAGFPLVVISQKLASTTDVTSQSVQTTIATQRRRLRS